MDQIWQQHKIRNKVKKNRPKFAWFIFVWNRMLQRSKLQNMHHICPFAVVIRIPNLTVSNLCFVCTNCHAFPVFHVYMVLFSVYFLNVIFVLSTIQLIRLKYWP